MWSGRDIMLPHLNPYNSPGFDSRSTPAVFPVLVDFSSPPLNYHITSIATHPEDVPTNSDAIRKFSSKRALAGRSLRRCPFNAQNRFDLLPTWPGLPKGWQPTSLF